MHRHEYIPIPISQKSNQNACPIGDRAQKYYSFIQATSMSHIVNVKLTECDPQVHCISVAMAAITKYHKLSGWINRSLSSQFWKLGVQTQSVVRAGTS